MSEQSYRYTECGLDNVYIHGVSIVTDDAGEEVYCIRNIGSLHKAIAHAIIVQTSGMSGKDLKFLRTEMGYTQEQIADVLSITRLTVSRWERGETPIDVASETVIRMLAAEKLEIDAKLTIEEMAKRSVWKAKPQTIQIDGSDPRNYKLAA